MSKAVNNIARGIEAGALKAGASMYVQTEVKMAPYDPTGETVSMDVVKLAGAENPDTWENIGWCNISASVSADISYQDNEVANINANAGTKVILEAEPANGYEVIGWFVGEGEGYKEISSQKTLTIEADGTYPVILAVGRRSE